jgi:hypothetical protein
MHERKRKQVSRDQEDHSSKPGWANSSLRPYLKKKHSQKKKKTGGEAQGVGCEFKPQYHKKKKERKNFILDLVTHPL